MVSVLGPQWPEQESHNQGRIYTSAWVTNYSLYLLYMNSELQIQDKEKYVKQLGGIHSHSVFAMVALINTVNGLLKHHEVTSKCRLYSHCVYFTVWNSSLWGSRPRQSVKISLGVESIFSSLDPYARGQGNPGSCSPAIMCYPAYIHGVHNREGNKNIDIFQIISTFIILSFVI